MEPDPAARPRALPTAQQREMGLGLLARLPDSVVVPPLLLYQQ
jgi:hypothetical protein